jgi:methylated-DNA-[protein]-cysteine S-methyltransferase
MNVSPELDAQFRTSALAEGIVDVRYDVVASPVGDLLIAATDRGLARIHFDAEGQEEVLARIFGNRVLRAPIDEVRRELDEYFEGRRRDLTCRSTCE